MPEETRDITARDYVDGFRKHLDNPRNQEWFREIKEANPSGLSAQDFVRELHTRHPEAFAGGGIRFNVTDVQFAPPQPPSSAPPTPQQPPVSREEKGVMYRALTPLSEQIFGEGASLRGAVEKAGKTAKEDLGKVPPGMRGVAQVVDAPRQFIQPIMENMAGVIDTFQSPVGIAGGAFGKLAMAYPWLAKAFGWGVKGAAAYAATQEVPKLIGDVVNLKEHPSPEAAGKVVSDVGNNLALAGALGGRVRPPASRPKPAPVAEPITTTDLAIRPTPGRTGPFMATPRQRALPAAPSEFRTSQEIVHASGAPYEKVDALAKMTTQDLQARLRLLKQSIEGETSAIRDVAQETAAPLRSEGGMRDTARVIQEGARPGEAGPRETVNNRQNLQAVRRRNELRNEQKAVEILLEDRARSAGESMPRTVRGQKRPAPPPPTAAEATRIHVTPPPPGSRSYPPPPPSERIAPPEKPIRTTPPQKPTLDEPVSRSGQVAVRQEAPVPPPHPGGNALPEAETIGGSGWVNPEARTRVTAGQANALAQKYGLNPSELVEISGVPDDQIRAAIDGLVKTKQQIQSRGDRISVTAGNDKAVQDIDRYVAALQEILGYRNPPPPMARAATAAAASEASSPSAVRSAPPPEVRREVIQQPEPESPRAGARKGNSPPEARAAKPAAQSAEIPEDMFGLVKQWVQKRWSTGVTADQVQRQFGLTKDQAAAAIRRAEAEFMTGRSFKSSPPESRSAPAAQPPTAAERPVSRRVQGDMERYRTVNDAEATPEVVMNAIQSGAGAPPGAGGSAVGPNGEPLPQLISAIREQSGLAEYPDLFRHLMFKLADEGKIFLNRVDHVTKESIPNLLHDPKTNVYYSAATVR